MISCLCCISALCTSQYYLGKGEGGKSGICAPVEMLRRVELLDELLGLGRPRGAGDGEGLAAEDLGVVDAQLRREDLIAQPIL